MEGEQTKLSFCSTTKRKTFHLHGVRSVVRRGEKNVDEKLKNEVGKRDMLRNLGTEENQPFFFCVFFGNCGKLLENCCYCHNGKTLARKFSPMQKAETFTHTTYLKIVKFTINGSCCRDPTKEDGKKRTFNLM